MIRLLLLIGLLARALAALVKVPCPAPPYRGPAAHVMHNADGSPWTNNLPPTRIVLHSTVGPCAPGQADAICAYFRSEASGGSAQYVVDPANVRQCVWDKEVAEHAPPNPNSLGVEMCDTPGPVPNDTPGSARWKAAKRAWRWIRPNQVAMLHLTARLVAQLALFYGVPLKFVTAADLVAGRHGITTHAEVSKAWHQTDHWDPGFWPQRRFMRLCRKYAAQLESGKLAPL